jgi:hypothetical protein
LKTLFFLLHILSCLASFAQEPAVRGGGLNRGGGGKSPIGGISDRLGTLNNGGGGGGQLDSLKKRNKLEDSITISYRLIANTLRYKLDSSISEYVRFPIPHNYIALGNNGAPAKPILFEPIMKSGFDEGKHALDIYKWKIENIKSYQTTRPYSELAYALGSGAEQLIQFTHTQNVKKDWNVAFDYRLISAPGYFRNQKNNHDNLVLNSHFISKNKRYQNWFIYLVNGLKHSDFGGIKTASDIDNPIFVDRSTVQTLLGNSAGAFGNPFSNKIESGQIEKNKTIYLKQSYDLGKKDSLVINDSTTIPLFYSKLRFEHTLTSNTESFAYKGLTSDSTYYKTYSSSDILFTKSGANWQIEDKWKNLINDFSVYSFPDAKNTLQYIKAGVSFENRKGSFYKNFTPIGSKSIYNIIGHFTYKNITKNKQWDIDATGNIYFAGFNSGDYEAKASLTRLSKSKLGNIKIGFENINRTPSFIYYNQSVFGYNPFTNTSKENHLQLTAQIFNPKNKQNISVQLLQSSNLMTWQNFNTYKREDLFNMLKFRFERSFKVYKKIVWHTNVEAQQMVIGNANINYAKLYTRNRIAYEGSLGKKNLKLATGLEIRYLAPYKIDAWSPLNSQFVYQDSISSKNNLPDIHAYMHFNITSFNGFLRVENLNTARYVNGAINQGLWFTNNNMVAVRYPSPGMVFRFGVYWRFVN